jgi:endonuclease/exonuclease/phosphatase family metal-dependent hydrolase
VKIVTFNLRCQWINDGINGFIHRAGFIYDKVRKELPAVICFQEVIPASLELLKKMLPEYEFFGQYRSKNYDGEGLFTAVLKDGFECVAFETFWLSPTPYVAGSRFEKQSECPRVCIMTKIRNKATGELFRTFNVHLDHVSDEARVLGLDCVVDFINSYNQKQALPVVLLGDFNAFPDSETIKHCEACGFLKELTKEVCGTFHGFGQTSQKIDYIYTTEEFALRCESAKKWEDVHEGIFLSDHYPVCVEIKD